MPEEKPQISNHHKHTISSFKFFGIEEIIFMTIILLSIIGVGITDYAPTESWAYWIFMAAVLCACAVLIEKNLLHRKDVSFSKLLITQLVH